MNLKQAMKKAKKTGKPETITELPKSYTWSVIYGKWRILRGRTIVRWGA